MGKSKVKTPTSEKYQANMARKNFDVGRAIKSSVGNEFRGDMRYDASSAKEAAASGISAVKQKKALKASRLKNKVSIAGDKFDASEAVLLGETQKGGKDTAGIEGKVVRDSRNVMDIGNIISKRDSDKAIESMYDENEKYQLAIDATVGASQGYAMHKQKQEYDKKWEEMMKTPAIAQPTTTGG